MKSGKRSDCEAIQALGANLGGTVPVSSKAGDVFVRAWQINIKAQ